MMEGGWKSCSVYVFRDGEGGSGDEQLQGKMIGQSKQAL
jgi:hypothetical protein